MRKIIAVFRNRNQTVVYFVIRDGAKFTIEVWRWVPGDSPSPEHVHTRPFIAHPDGWLQVSDSEREAVRRATALANSLSRMTGHEADGELAHIRSTGTTR